MARNNAKKGEEEIRRNHECAQEVSVTKIKDFTHVVKIEFQSIEVAERSMERGFLLFCMHVTPDQITRY